VITVLGGSGFIGSHLVRHLRQLGIDHGAPARDELLEGRALGHIIYCIGLTGDFRERPSETMEAHVGHLVDVIRTASFESLLYLSSARVYLDGSSPAREEDPLCFRPLDGDSLYGLSKAAGEALVMSLGPKGRIARPTNIYGEGQSDRFLAMLLDEARTNRTFAVRMAMDSERDYVSVDDVAALLVKIALGGRHRIYNIASGSLIRNAQVVEAICAASGCRATFLPGAQPHIFPRIDNARIRNEFGFAPADILVDLPGLIGAMT